MKGKGHWNARVFVILLLNVMILSSVVLLYLRYTSVFQDRLREENLLNIANLNQSAANNASALINSWDTKLDDIKQYVERYGLNYEQTLAFLCDGNASEERQLELIGNDYTGHLALRDANGGYVPLTYAASTYADLQRIFSGGTVGEPNAIRFAPEFTDGYTALKYFAIYDDLYVQSPGGMQKRYTLLLANKSKDVLAAFNTQDVFVGLSSVLIDANGRYIVSNTDFKSDNFYQYLYVYNNLTLDQRNAIHDEVAQKGSGELYYVDSEGRECVFRYVRMTTNDWYCVTSVPLSSFHTPLTNINYAVYVVALLLLLLIIDVLWLRELNRRLRGSMRREQESSSAKTEFLSRMSHDIRTPLNGIIGLTSLAMDEPNPPRTVEYLENIKTSGDFLLGLVNDILDMSKVESGMMELNPEPYCGAEFTRYIEAVIAPLCATKHQELRVTPSEGDELVMFDRLRLNQIFFNLLSNAVKYTPEGGLIELLWTREFKPDRRVAFEFIVRDNGVGMSDEFQRRMFDAFSQEHTSGMIPGSGLGLSIVWNLVNLMGGKIRVDSAEGRGTTVYVWLETTLSDGPARPSQHVGNGELTGARILICEDNQINALIVQRLLDRWGASCDVAENGRIGVDRFAASEPGAYDAVLMDVQMPEMNGYEATRAMRALDRPDANLPIIAMTANAYDVDVQNCLQAGMNAHTAKPIQPERLHELLRRYIDRT